MEAEAKKAKRIILNLTPEQASELNEVLINYYLNKPSSAIKESRAELIKKISKRINWTIMKQDYIEKCKADGFKPTKEQILKFKESIK